MTIIIRKVRFIIYLTWLKIRNYFYSLIYGSFIFRWMVVIFERVANAGYGSNECLKHGFLPVPVHYYSSIPDIEDLKKRKIWDKKSSLEGIDFNPKGQLQLLKKLGQKYGSECVWPLNATPNPAEFYAFNYSFGFGCAAALYSLIREFKPKRIIEIGSGNSSQVIAQAINVNVNKERHRTRYLIVDPYPVEFVKNKLIGFNTLLAKRVELLKPDFFDQLGENDILFIDSGHSVRIGGDVNFLYLEILPRLKKGVIVHIHDIGLPYEYPKVYATSEVFRQFWTEQYLLQGFLMFNKNFEIMLAMNHLMTDHFREFCRAFPAYDRESHKFVSGSFWMKKVK